MHTHIAIRNCGDVPAGKPLTIEDPSRAALMERMHMVRSLADGSTSSRQAVEDTAEANTLDLSASVKQLPTILRGIEDVAALEAALASESRSTAKRHIKARLAELESSDG